MPPKGGDHQLLDDTAFDDSRRRRSSKYAAEHEHERAVMSGRGDRESDRGEKRQPRRRTSEDKARAPRGDDDDGEVPATLSFTPPQNEKAYYEGLFHAATAGARRRGHSSDEIARAGISVNDASRFLALSGLPANHLQVMISTARSGGGSSSRGAGSNPLEMLSKADFFVAVRLVQLRQNHCRVTDLDLNAVRPEDGSEMKPPHFKGVSDVSVPLPGSAKESGMKTVRSATQIADLLNEDLPETELGREMTWPPEDQTDRRSSMRRSGSSQKLVTSGMEEIGHDSFNSRQSNRSTKEKDRSSKDKSSRRDPSTRDRHDEKARGRRRSDASNERRVRSHSASKLRDSTRLSARSRSGSRDGLRRKNMIICLQTQRIAQKKRFGNDVTGWKNLLGRKGGLRRVALLAASISWNEGIARETKILGAAAELARNGRRRYQKWCSRCGKWRKKWAQPGNL